MKSLLSLSRSFVPVLLVLVIIYLGLLNIHFTALSSADRVTIIQIEANQATEAAAEEDLDNVNELDAYLDKTYLKGIELLNQRKLEEVNQVVSELNTMQKLQLALLLQGRLEMVRGKSQSALEYFNQIHDSGDTPLSMYFFRARVHARLNNSDLAIKDYDRVLANNSNHFSANFNRALLLYERDDYVEAAKGFSQAAGLAAGLRKARAFAKLSRCQLKLKQLDAAETSANNALRFAPGLIEARMTLAKVNIERGQLEEALAEYDRIKSLGPTDASTFVTLARFYQQQGRLQSAELMYRQAIQHKPKRKKQRIALAEMLIDQERWIEAAQQYQSIVQFAPDDPDPYFQLGRITQAQKNFQQAIGFYEKVIELNQGDSPESWLNIGLVYKDMDAFEKALAAYDKAIAINDDYYQAWYNKALANIGLGQFDKAVENLQKAVAINPEYSRAWYNLGIVYTKLNDDQQAIAAYKKALEIRPEYHAAKLNLAVRLSKQEDYQSAEKLYREVLQARPYYKSAWYNLGLALSRQGKIEDAIPVFEKVIEIDNDHYRARNQLADIFFDRQDYVLVQDYLKQTLDIKPENIKARLLLARTYKRLQRYDDALKSARQVLALRPNSSRIQNLIRLIETEREATSL